MQPKHLLLFFLSGPCFLLQAQDRLQADLNMYRAGDTIVKQQVEYKHPGRMGENVLWDFGKLKAVDTEYSVIYSNVQDSTGCIAGTEHQTRYYYTLRNDSLLLSGYENPTTHVTYTEPELLLKFPVGYGDRVEGHYQGEGIYCDRLDITAYGSSRSLADAYGVLILPNGDTLRQVTRVRTIKLVSENIRPTIRQVDSLSSEGSAKPMPIDSIRYHLDTDSVVLMVDTYRWYASGWRYPVFETIRTGNYRDDSKTYFTTAFFYPPEEHRYPASDKETAARQESLRNASASAGNGNTTGNQGTATPADEIEITYNIYPNPVESHLTFEFYISRDARVSYSLYSITGMLLYHQPARGLQSGAYGDTIDMGRYLRGEYILHLQVNDKVYSEKILKK